MMELYEKRFHTLSFGESEWRHCDLFSEDGRTFWDDPYMGFGARLINMTSERLTAHCDYWLLLLGT